MGEYFSALLVGRLLKISWSNYMTPVCHVDMATILEKHRKQNKRCDRKSLAQGMIPQLSARCKQHAKQCSKGPDRMA